MWNDVDGIWNEEEESEKEDKIYTSLFNYHLHNAEKNFNYIQYISIRLMWLQLTLHTHAYAQRYVCVHQ